MLSDFALFNACRIFVTPLHYKTITIVVGAKNETLCL